MQTRKENPFVALTKNKVLEVIQLAEEYQRALDQDRAPFHPPPPQRDVLLESITQLTREELSELVALMWLGRGDYKAGNWPDIVAKASREQDMNTPRYVVEKGPLPNYLINGLRELGL